MTLIVTSSQTAYAACMELDRQHPPRRQHGLTDSARHLLAVLRGRDHPTSAKELWAQEHGAGHSTGLATIYRAMHALTAAGLVHEFHHEDETTYRACGPEHHDHLICRVCGRIQELHLPWHTHHLQQLIQDGFVADEFSVEVHGRCRSCAIGTGPVPQAECS